MTERLVLSYLSQLCLVTLSTTPLGKIEARIAAVVKRSLRRAYCLTT
jgi:hypothetical protein